MVSSIRNFARELGSSHVVKSHAEKQRSLTFKRTATTNEEFQELEERFLAKIHHKKPPPNSAPPISPPFHPRKRTIDFDEEKGEVPPKREPRHKHSKNRVATGMKALRRVGSRKPKILMMREEKDRFDAMRTIQQDTHKFKRYSALSMSIIACEFHLHHAPQSRV